jgi:ribokinase
MAMIVVAADGENPIVVASGANRALNSSAVGDLRATLCRDEVLVMQLEIPIETCLAAADAARRAGARVVLNPAPLPKPGASEFGTLLRAVDVLIVNETEALALADRAAPGTLAGWIGLAGELLRHGPAACVITLGGQGAVAHDGTDGWAQPAFAADVVDTFSPAAANNRCLNRRSRPTRVTATRPSSVQRREVTGWTPIRSAAGPRRSNDTAEQHQIASLR